MADGWDVKIGHHELMIRPVIRLVRRLHLQRLGSPSQVGGGSEY